MSPSTVPDPLARLAARLHRVTVALALVILGIVLLMIFAWIRLSRPDALRVRTLSVLDDRGVERVRIAGQLPDAVVEGKRVPRGEAAAGVLIYDDAGQERGGYVTFAPSRNAVLTLDTRRGQVVLLAADSSGGAAFRLWHTTSGDWIDLRAESAGARLSVGRRDGIVLQEPPMSEADAAAFCAGLKDDVSRLKTQLPTQEVLRACQQRMPSAACRKCLGIH
jgi:hypothetical protein